MAELAELMAARALKLRRMTERGVGGYPHRFPATHRIGALLTAFAAATDAESDHDVAFCGRVVSWRDHGKSAFAHLEDATGRLQAYFKKDALGDPAWEALKDLDVGDFAGVRGRVFRTRTGELTVRAAECVMLAKALRPPPEKWHGLKDVDTRYRNRHVDLAANPEVRSIFATRARAIQLIREFLNARGYLEVETPVLQPLYGGAEATPFTTYYESLKTTYYLRISNELYLKRCLAGGLDRVYEFSKDFRNEGIDRTHLPEFTLLELYEAFADYHDMMALTEELFRHLVVTLTGQGVIEYQGHVMDFSKPWPRIAFAAALAEKLGYDPLAADDAALRASARACHLPDADKLSRPKLLDKLFGELVQPGISGPAFVLDHPLELSPLAKTHRADPRLAERFEPILAGSELGNAFSELNDPAEQRRRFEAQRALSQAGDRETHALDEEFLAVLEAGMPPAGGLGIGIDRLMMVLTGSTAIREVILFPQLKPAADDV